jgi:Tfp pilus assembly protein PilV
MNTQRTGFTLISVLFALTLLSIGIMALARLQFTITRVAREESSRTTALQLAASYLEEVRARDPWSLANEGPHPVDSTGIVNAGGTFTRQLIVGSINPQLLRVRVAVTPTQARPVTLETMIFRAAR